MTLHASIPESQRGHTADIGYVRRVGGGKPAASIVLLHGIGSNSRSFAPLMAALPSGLDVLAWDAPGYGDSVPLPEPSPATSDYAAALKRLLDALGIGCIVLAGHSLGALFAGCFAAMHPDRVSALALISPALGYRVPSGAPLPEALQSRIDDMQRLGPAEFASGRAPRLVGDPQSNPHIVSAVEKGMAAVRPAGYAQAVHALGAGDLVADAARIEIPVMIVVGTQDAITPPGNARAAYDVLRQPSGYHLVERAGHALPQEEPEALAKLLAQFAEEHADV